MFQSLIDTFSKRVERFHEDLHHLRGRMDLMVLVALGISKRMEGSDGSIGTCWTSTVGWFLRRFDEIVLDPWSLFLGRCQKPKKDAKIGGIVSLQIFCEEQQSHWGFLRIHTGQSANLSCCNQRSLLRSFVPILNPKLLRRMGYHCNPKGDQYRTYCHLSKRCSFKKRHEKGTNM